MSTILEELPIPNTMYLQEHCLWMRRCAVGQQNQSGQALLGDTSRQASLVVEARRSA